MYREKFEIIPVIDVMGGIAVHAIKGIRNRYESLKTSLTKSSSPIDLIKSYEKKFSFTEVYVADLDSIISEKPNTTLLKDLIDITSLKIMLDAGIRNLYDIIYFKNIGIQKIILATETIDSLDVIDDAIKELGVDRIVISIDMKNKKILARNLEINKLSISSFIEKILQKGIQKIILLDLVKIGSKCGCYEDSYGEIRKKFPNIEIIIGGGVKGIEDIKLLRDKEMNGVLIATALHEGVINPGNINEFLNNK
ncbi:MAG: HisA/HisF-related TIM barrel protein [Promethearchaeota archaeon]